MTRLVLGADALGYTRSLSSIPTGTGSAMREYSSKVARTNKNVGTDATIGTVYDGPWNVVDGLWKTRRRRDKAERRALSSHFWIVGFSD
jgi:hypothetical protein